VCVSLIPPLEDMDDRRGYNIEVVGGWGASVMVRMHLYMSWPLSQGATSSQSMRLRQPTCPPCTGTPARMYRRRAVACHTDRAALVHMVDSLNFICKSFILPARPWYVPVHALLNHIPRRSRKQEVVVATTTASGPSMGDESRACTGAGADQDGAR
jgi:hypothetical protein